MSSSRKPQALASVPITLPSDPKEHLKSSMLEPQPRKKSDLYFQLWIQNVVNEHLRTICCSRTLTSSLRFTFHWHPISDQ